MGVGEAFDVLGLTPTDDLAAVERRHRQLSRQIHPDLNASAPAAVQALLGREQSRLNEARALLRQRHRDGATLVGTDDDLDDAENVEEEEVADPFFDAPASSSGAGGADRQEPAAWEFVTYGWYIPIDKGRYDVAEVVTVLNDLGSRGWELVSANGAADLNWESPAGMTDAGTYTANAYCLAVFRKPVD